MLLTYSKDSFVEAIQKGGKIHTIRADPHRRWRPRMTIQHWRGNPRNVRAKPYKFADGECKGVQDIGIVCTKRSNWGVSFIVFIDGRPLVGNEIETLAKNDGLTLDEFGLWFLKDTDAFDGRIIHFTDFKY